jgi:transposase-like protein
VTDFVQVFNKTLDQIEADAREVGLTLTSICRETGVSRATPDRWRKKTPTTIKLLSDMQKVIADRRAKLDEEQKNALHHD